MGVTRAQCPACAANIPDDGYSEVLTCNYCGTRVTIHRSRPAAPLTRTVGTAPRPRTERDELLERLRTEEASWDRRIRAAEGMGGADIALPLVAGVLVFGVMVMIAYAFDKQFEQLGLLALPAAAVFWLSGPIVAIVINRLRARGRTKRALIIARHRDEALGPLRARIAQLEKPAPLTEKQRRVQTLEFERQDLRRRIDQAYLMPEAERTSGRADFFMFPSMGCLVFFLWLAIGTTIIFNYAEEHSNLVGFIVWVGPFLGFFFISTVPILWRAITRRIRVRKLEEQRDEIAPKLQAKLNEVESELARLTRS
ncbi:MAG TPA: hypothetical protein VNI54_01690 [Thermoanaerobaculia bacterium]|nr:hypothetical protein [Thermoanaerobaculia bacterium]